MISSQPDERKKASRWRATVIESLTPEGGTHYAILVGPERVEEIQEESGQHRSKCPSSYDNRPGSREDKSAGDKGEPDARLRLPKL